MGIFRSFGSICFYPCAIFILFISILLGWIFTTPVPEGTIFATLIPLVNGKLPSTIFGDVTPLVNPVPDDISPEDRPSKEILFTLSSGAEMPSNGIGLCCRASAYDFESVKRTVVWYLMKGGRLLDTAQLYLNHKAVGAGIQEAIKRGIPREEIYVTTKITPRFFSGDSISKLIPEFLEELQVEYLDLVLLHHPEGFPLSVKCAHGTPSECRANGWDQLSQMKNKGFIRDIGISNFGIRQIKQLQALNLSPISVNQIQYNPWAPDWQQEVVDFCQENNIVITAWGSFQGTLMQHAAMFTVETLKGISDAKSKSVPQIMLRWAIQKGVAVIPGTGNPKHMAENLAIFDFELTADEMKQLDNIRSDPKAKDFVAMGFENNQS